MDEKDIGPLHGYDADMPEVMAGIRTYIMEGDRSGVSLPLMGLEVYAVAAALREGDEEFHGDDSTLAADQRARVEEVEGMMDAAVAADEQYYPFGHRANKRILPASEKRRMEGDSSWGTGVAGSRNRKAGHGGEFVAGKYLEATDDSKPDEASQGKS